MAAGTSLMDRRLLEAAMSGGAGSIKHLVQRDPGTLLATTPRGNTCLHIASIYGHRGFCEDALALDQSLLAAINADGETPLLSAVTSGHVSLAFFLLRCCREHGLGEAILKQDKHACNALHHAIRSSHKELALELIAAEPVLSHAVNEYNESPMFIAVMRDFKEIYEKLLEIPDSADGGTYGCNALHAAVRRSNKDAAKKIIKRRPGLARGGVIEKCSVLAKKKQNKAKNEENEAKKEQNKARKITPVQLAVRWNRIDELIVLLENDWSLGYEVSAYGETLLSIAAFGGHIDVARELLNRCPDAPSCNTDGWTCLHNAVWNGQTKFVEFVLCPKELHKLVKLVNMRNSHGKTALHYAVQKCNPKMVSTILSRTEVDVTMFDKEHKSAMWKLFDAGDHAKTLNWNEIRMYMLKADPEDTTSISNLHTAIKDKITDVSRKDVKSLTQTYTSNTSLVAILIATITFAAAFTLPGGYSSETGNEGLPIMSRKFAFQAFLISDTLAMCSSLAVAFICIISRLDDLEFLLYYRSFTKKLMWFAYQATVMAFATGLYTVLAPRLLWLAITICVLSVLLPIFTYLLGKWPILKLSIRSGGGTFKSDILDMFDLV